MPDTSMSDTPLHDWLRPRVQHLLDEARAAGFARDLVVAVLLDVAGGAGMNDAPLPPEPPLPSGPWPQPHDDREVDPMPDLSGHMPPMIGRIRQV